MASSSGAVIAIDLAVRHGRLLRGVVLSEPPLFSLDPDAARAVGAQLDKILHQPAGDGPERVVAELPCYDQDPDGDRGQLVRRDLEWG